MDSPRDGHSWTSPKTTPSHRFVDIYFFFAITHTKKQAKNSSCAGIPTICNKNIIVIFFELRHSRPQAGITSLVQRPKRPGQSKKRNCEPSEASRHSRTRPASGTSDQGRAGGPLGASGWRQPRGDRRQRHARGRRRPLPFAMNKPRRGGFIAGNRRKGEVSCSAP